MNDFFFYMQINNWCVRWYANEYACMVYLCKRNEFSAMRWIWCVKKKAWEGISLAYHMPICKQPIDDCLFSSTSFSLFCFECFFFLHQFLAIVSLLHVDGIWLRRCWFFFFWLHIFSWLVSVTRETNENLKKTKTQRLNFRFCFFFCRYWNNKF